MRPDHELDMSTKANVIEGDKMPTNEEIINKEWDSIVANPDVLTDLSEQNIVFGAGGGLVKRFGDENSEIWKSLEAKAVDGKTTVAGIEFTTSELATMGSFYRSLGEKGFNFHCIDERLEGDTNHLHNEVHAGCGACAAVGAAAGLENVEDKLLNELDQSVKQEIYGDMPNHESLVVLVDLGGADVVLGEKRNELKGKKALPFNASIPLQQVADWASETGGDGAALVDTMVRWNVQIARNIIGGHHNTLHDSADKTTIVVDARKVGENPLLDSAMTAIENVDHGQIKKIV